MAREGASNGLMVTAGTAKAWSAFLPPFLWVLMEVVELYRISTDPWFGWGFVGLLIYFNFPLHLSHFPSAVLLVNVI